VGEEEEEEEEEEGQRRRRPKRGGCTYCLQQLSAQLLKYHRQSHRFFVCFHQLHMSESDGPPCRDPSDDQHSTSGSFQLSSHSKDSESMGGQFSPPLSPSTSSGIVVLFTRLTTSELVPFAIDHVVIGFTCHVSRLVLLLSCFIFSVCL
jgi:hypothetical protein